MLKVACRTTLSNTVLCLSLFASGSVKSSSSSSIAILRQQPQLKLRQLSIMATNNVHGDLNDTNVMRETNFLVPDAAYNGKTLAISEEEDDVDIRCKYRPFISHPEVANNDWISKSELSTALKISEADLKKTGGNRVKILVLYGSLRERLVQFLLFLFFAIALC
jgi:hypothetical protein